MATFLQDQSGDLQITNGKLSVVTGAQAGALKLFNKFRLFTFEWFRDIRQGVPYFPRIFASKKVDLNVVRQLFSGIIRSTPGVKSLDSLSVDFDPGTRTANVSFQATWDDGATITADTLDQPFIVTVPQQGATA